MVAAMVLGGTEECGAARARGDPEEMVHERHLHPRVLRRRGVVHHDGLGPAHERSGLAQRAGPGKRTQTRSAVDAPPWPGAGWGRRTPCGRWAATDRLRRWP